MSSGYDPLSDPNAVDTAQGDPAYVNALVQQTAPRYPIENVLAMVRSAQPGPAPTAPRAGFLDRLASGLANVQSPGASGAAGDVFGANLLSGAARSFGAPRVAARDAALKQQMADYANQSATNKASASAGITGLTQDYETRAKLASEAARTLAAHRYSKIAKPEPTIEEKAKEKYAVTKAEQQAKRDFPTGSDGGEEPVLSEDAIHARLATYLQGLGEPTFGMGKAGVANRVRFNNALGELVKNGGVDVGTRISAAKAERDNLNKLTQTQGAAGAFGETVEKNLKILEPTLGGIPDTPLTPLNALLRGGASKLGSKGMSAFNTARQIVVPEFTRILNNPSLAGAGVITDTARKEMQTIIDPNATVGQIKTAIKILREDKNNRLKSYADAIQESQGRIRSLGLLPGAKGGRADVSLPQPGAPQPGGWFDQNKPGGR